MSADRLAATRSLSYRASPWQTDAMTSRADVHRLVDAVPNAGLPELEQALRTSLTQPRTAAPRRFSCAGTLSAEHDLAERAEDILLDDESSTAT